MNTSQTPAREQLTKLAEALYRFSQSLDSSFAMHLKELAVQLAGALSANDEEAVAGTLARAKGVLDLGARVGAVAANDVQVISAAIARSRDLALPVSAKKAPSVAVFAEIGQEGQPSPQPTVTVEQHSTPASEAARSEFGPATQPHTVPAMAPATIESAQAAVSATPSAADRQARIVAAIRQNPNARMRDLLAALPGVSERTIRYDLERLVASGTIEREGVGGPATWYRVREGVTR